MTVMLSDNCGLFPGQRVPENPTNFPTSAHVRLGCGFKGGCTNPPLITSRFPLITFSGEVDWKGSTLFDGAGRGATTHALSSFYLGSSKFGWCGRTRRQSFNFFYYVFVLRAMVITM